MHEFDSVSVSTYEASSLAAKLTAKSGEGWDVVAIVPTGSDITAFLKREGSGGTDAAAAATTAEPAAAATAEPAGWGTAPEASSTSGSSWGADSGAASSYGTAAASAPADSGSSWGSTAGTPAAAAAAATPAASTPSVPPGWYADPANRYELRYWDGSAWTEHVSRAGQQYTDPPVA